MPDSTTTITFYTHCLHNGGIETVNANLSHAFINRGYNVHLVTNHIGNTDALKLFHPKTKSIPLNAGKTFSRITRLIQYLKEHTPHALLSATHFNNEIAILASRFAKTKTLIIPTEHSTLSHDCKTVPFYHPRRLTPITTRFFYPKANHTITVSQGVEKDLKTSAKLSSNITTIYNPIITDQLHKRAQEPCPHPWLSSDFTSHTPTLIAVGRFAPAKDYHNLIQAYHLIRQQRNIKLLFLGVGELQQQIRSLTTSLNHNDDIQFLGFIKNPYPYIKRASTLVLSSYYEGLPTVLVEALALRTPIASTDCPSGPSEITANGKYAHLAPTRNPQALANAITQTLDNPLPPPPLSHLNQFTLDHAADQYLQIMNLPTHTLEPQPLATSAV
ncbi:glycosyltransferase [Planctomycetota bacterium]|nr:glycosyltransferase [Planctomycetota bacterium]